MFSRILILVRIHFDLPWQILYRYATNCRRPKINNRPCATSGSDGRCSRCIRVPVGRRSVSVVAPRFQPVTMVQPIRGAGDTFLTDFATIAPKNMSIMSKGCKAVVMIPCTGATKAGWKCGRPGSTTVPRLTGISGPRPLPVYWKRCETPRRIRRTSACSE